jgi:hypothetical protein
MQSQIDSITIPDYFSDILFLQWDIDTINNRINYIDKIDLQDRVTPLELQVTINTQAISDIQIDYSVQKSGK